MDFMKYCEEQKQKIDLHLSKTLSALQAKKQELVSPSQTNEKASIHDEIKRIQNSMDNLRTELLQKDMPLVNNDVNLITQSLEITRKKQEEIDRIKREQETLRLERERIEDEKEKLKKEAESLRQERELILLAATKKQQLLSQSQIIEPTTAYSQDFTYIPNQHDHSNVMYNKKPLGTSLQSHARKQFIHTINQVPKPKYMNDPFTFNTQSHKQLNNSSHWVLEEAERQRMAERQSLARQSAGQNLRRSTPNLVKTNDLLSQSMIQPKSFEMHHQRQQQQQQQAYRLATSQYDLNRTQQPLSGYERSNNNNFNSHQHLNLYKTCSACNQELNQTSAMVIETLNLAFHIPCFRCSVCNVPLTNGKEGTEVRVRGTKLHCNNCFSNDKGN